MAAACLHQELTLFQLPDGLRSRSADPLCAEDEELSARTRGKPGSRPAVRGCRWAGGSPAPAPGRCRHRGCRHS